jgi:hypothetical protein
MGSNGWRAAGQLLHDEFVLDWPQSGERIRGRESFVAVNANYPASGPWRFNVLRFVAVGGGVASDVTVTDGAIQARAVRRRRRGRGRAPRRRESQETEEQLDVATIEVAIDDSVYPGDYINYREAYDYSTNVDESVETIAQVLKDGHAAEAIDLAEHALAAVESAIEMVDDSDDHMGGILERLQELHLAACKKAKPNPEGGVDGSGAQGLRAQWLPDRSTGRGEDHPWAHRCRQPWVALLRHGRGGRAGLREGS